MSYVLNLNFKTNVKSKYHVSDITSAVSKVDGWLVQLRSFYNFDQPPHSFHASISPGKSEVAHHGEEICGGGESDQQN